MELAKQPVPIGTQVNRLRQELERWLDAHPEIGDVALLAVFESRFGSERDVCREH